jgi:hypothetical protein
MQPLKQSEPILTLGLRMMTENNDVHPSKHLSPMEVTELGIVMDDNDGHLKKQ